MAYWFFYLSLAATVIALILCMVHKKLLLSNIIIAITSASYSLAFDLLFGDILGLYHYISPQVNMIYMLVSAIFLYPLLNIIYTLFLPSRTKPLLWYTGIWIVVMLVFEYFSVAAKTIVFTGWKPIPWSIATYILTYLWIVVFYRILSAKLAKQD